MEINKKITNASNLKNHKTQLNGKILNWNNLVNKKNISSSTENKKPIDKNKESIPVNKEDISKPIENKKPIDKN